MGYALPKGNVYRPLDVTAKDGGNAGNAWSNFQPVLFNKKAFARAFSAEARYFLLRTQKKVPKEKGAPSLVR